MWRLWEAMLHMPSPPQMGRLPYLLSMPKQRLLAHQARAASHSKSYSWVRANPPSNTDKNCLLASICHFPKSDKLPASNASCDRKEWRCPLSTSRFGSNAKKIPSKIFALLSVQVQRLPGGPTKQKKH